MQIQQNEIHMRLSKWLPFVKIKRAPWVFLKYIFALKWQHLVRGDGLKTNLIFWYVICSRYSSRFINTSKMVFKMAAMGYPQINLNLTNTTVSLNWLLMQPNYDLLINYIEFGLVQYGIGMPFSKWPSFSHMAIIYTYI